MQISILLIIFLLKIIDCSTGTLKNLYLIKNQYFISAVLSAIGGLVWYISVLLGIKANSLYSAAIIALGTFIGSYYTAKIFKASEKEKIWTFNLTMILEDEVDKLQNYCKEHNIQYAIMPCLNDRYYFKLFSRSKEQSVVISKIIKSFNDSQIQMLIETSISDAEE